MAEMTEKEYEVYVRETNWHRGMVTAVSEEDAVGWWRIFERISFSFFILSYFIQ